MLYVTTRNQKDHCTSHCALSANTDEQGGLYIPFQAKSFAAEDIEHLKDKPFCQCVADVLNMFFSARLDAWDIASSMGTHPLKLVPMSHKVTVAEVWNNPQWCLSRFIRNINGRILGNSDTGNPSNWMEIAVKIAVLFGIFGKLCRLGIAGPDKTVDLSVISGDFSTPMAAWYARNMGLPIGTIIFACNENSAAWELLHHGETRTRMPVIHTSTPECDVCFPVNMERLIYALLGAEESSKLAECCASNGIYALNEEARSYVCSGMFGAVIGEKRTRSIIRNVYSTSAYIMSPYSALAYGGLQDFRACRSETAQALILTEQGPLYTADYVADAIGISVDALRERLCSI